MAPSRILNPHSVPVTGTDAHLPAVAAVRLTASGLRATFADAAGWVPELAGDGRPALDRRLHAASVLVPLVQRDSGLQVLLTRRAEHLRDHGGQISFPGGRRDARDADDAATALREAEEEIGLPRDHVDVIGHLPAYTTVTQFVVTPVVALVRPPLALRLDPAEVAEAFEVPLSFLMTPAHHHRHVFSVDGDERQFLSMPWRSPAADGTPVDHFIWGATAAMLRNLYHFLSR